MGLVIGTYDLTHDLRQLVTKQERRIGCHTLELISGDQFRSRQVVNRRGHNQRRAFHFLDWVHIVLKMSNYNKM